MKKGIVTRILISLLLLLQIAGCAGHQAFQQGEDLVQREQYDEAVLHYFRAVQKNPGSHEFRMRLQNARMQAGWQHLESGRRLKETGEYTAALAELQQAAALDPSNQAARQEAANVRDLLQAEKLLKDAEQFYRSRKFPQARDVLEESLQLHPDNPKALELLAKVKDERRTVMDGFELDVASDKPITLKFKDAEIRDVFSILSRLSGINFIFDEDVRSQKVSILLENATFSQALELLLRLNSLDRKILNAKTILIYPQTKEKEKKFEDQIIQTFYLSNIDAKKAVNLLRTMLQLRKIYVHEELNALVIRDSPATIKLAQQIIEAADRSDSEVVFELELVEVSHNDSLNIGPKLSAYGTSFGFVPPGTTSLPGEGSVTVSGLSSLDFLYTLPTASFNLQKTLSDSEILANPKIRVKNKEKAKVHIGSREPIVTNTLTASGDVTSTNVQYVDVGVKLDVEPIIQLDNSVVTKLSLEVSNVADRQEIAGGRGGEALTISTTNAQTSLILRDGEQTIIGGLIRDDVKKSKTTFPLLGRIPLFGDLISSHSKDKTKREILLSITPHIVRTVGMPRSDVATIWSGGEDDLEAGARFGSFAIPLEPEISQRPPATAPAISPATTAAMHTALPLSPSAPGPGESGESAPPTLLETPPDAAAGDDREASEPLAASSRGETPVAGSSAEAPALPLLPIPPANPAARLELEAPPQVAAGEEFGVTIRVEGVENLYSAPLFVTYEPQRFEFARAEEGDFLKTSAQPTVFTTSPDPQSGRLIIGYKQGVGGSGATGSGLLFRLVFKAREAGAGQIALDRLNFRDPSGNRLPVTGGRTLVEVK